MNTKPWLVPAAAAVLALSLVSLAAGARSASVQVFARLDTAQEVPSPHGTKQAAAGSFAGVIRDGTFRGVLATLFLTGPTVSAHIHLGQRGKAGPVVLTLCSGPCPDMIVKRIPASVLAAIKKGIAYVNIHTALNPGGEVRGQITAGTG